ncbi:hypothetical protein Lal_00037783 [Lupinus albus]|nr:hypothetical protein Lal_00037783 [Lupinus albus]
MVSTRSMTRENDSWMQECEKMRQEREELRLRLEQNEVRTKNTEEMLAAIATKLGISKSATSVGESSENGGEAESHKTHQNHDRWHKLEIPIFLGEDAYVWVQKFERYFTLKAISEEERMQATMLALDGKALRSVEAYVEEFEKYAGALQKINPDFVRGIFLNGLKEKIRVEMMLYELETLPEIPLLPVTTRGNVHLWGVAGASRTVQEVDSSKSMGEYMRLTSAKLMEKREKGPCFRCDEPFTRDHICKNKQLRMIILAEEEEAEKGEAEEDI